jgi:hypothetical protein
VRSEESVVCAFDRRYTVDMHAVMWASVKSHGAIARSVIRVKELHSCAQGVQDERHDGTMSAVSDFVEQGVARSRAEYEIASEPAFHLCAREP